MKQQTRTVLPLCEKTDYCKITWMRMCVLCAVTKIGWFTSHALYAVPHVHVTSEVYFGLKGVVESHGYWVAVLYLSSTGEGRLDEKWPLKAECRLRTQPCRRNRGPGSVCWNQRWRKHARAASEPRQAVWAESRATLQSILLKNTKC